MLSSMLLSGEETDCRVLSLQVYRYIELVQLPLVHAPLFQLLYSQKQIITLPITSIHPITVALVSRVTDADARIS